MKTLVNAFLRLLVVSTGLFILSQSDAFSQNQPNLLDLRTCGKSCSSNNFTIKEVYLSNASGVPLANSFATCTPGVQQTAYISFVYSSNSGSSTDNTRLFADLVIGGTSQYINIWLGNLPAAKSGDRVVTLNYQFTWTCGLEVSLRNPLMAWTTSGSANLFNSYQCNDYPSAQCQFGADILVNAPLAVQFDFTACTENGNTSVNFTSTSNGGKKPYTYSWNFGTNSSPTTSNQANPSVVYSSNGTATLTLTDANGVSNTFTKNILLPSEITYSSSVNQPTPGNSDGSISLTINGGTGNKSVTWNDGGTGSSRTNLAPGTYVATITDEFNCLKTATFVLSSPTPGVSLVKTGLYEDFNNDGIQNAGDRINYTFTIGNTGNFPLTNVSISDPAINVNGSPISLGVGESNSTSFTGFHTIVQNDLEQGFFTNTATVSATAGSIVLTNTDSHTENFTISPRISVQKIQVGGPNPVTNPNQVIEYRISVSNVGNKNISNVSVLDFLPGTPNPVVLNVESGDTIDPGILNVGEEWIFSIYYSVTQAVFDLGENIVNVVNVASTQIPGPVVASASTPIVQSPALSIDKSVAESSFDAVGDVLNYNIVVTNTGNTT
ncbi:PKD domain-containing protein, partial [Mariniradius saccharolyticus]|uniref:PKD domain-containing protein n=1 Tax=Mariniradius saccharolyticus TaxID=1245591 RepID=UPI00058C2DFF